jgi:hypothetical protein
LLVGSASAQVLTPPAVGGSASAFEPILGSANDATVGAQFHYLRCAGTDVDQFVVLAPNDHVWTIERHYCEFAALPADQRFAEAAQFLPPDATPGDMVTSVEGPGQTYVSQSVADALPAALFHDCLGQPVPVGTVVVVADDDGGWFMGPGTCA